VDADGRARNLMTDPADRIIDLYQRRAREYDEARGRSLFERSWLDRFTALLPPGGSVLDIGSGSGEPIARHLLASGFAVTGVDAARALLELCQSRFPSATWVVADMRTLALGRRFDGLIAWDSFFHLRPEDQRAMFPIFGAHATPNGALMFTSGPSFGEAVGTFEAEPLYHGSLDAAEYRALLAVEGFEVVAHVAEDATCGGHTVWLAQRR
jgi:SAM-dependent methyltransferase